MNIRTSAKSFGLLRSIRVFGATRFQSMPANVETDNALLMSEDNTTAFAGAETTRQSLRTRVLRAGVWTIIAHIVCQVLRLGSNLVMTHLLIPEMFGIMALANVLITGLHLLSDLGLKQNIVQRRDGHDAAFLNTIWSVQILRGGIIWAAALGMALTLHVLGLLKWLPPSSVYAEPILPVIIAVLSFNALISGFESTKLATASRNLVLGKLTLIELFTQIAGIALMLAWAAVDRSIWALVVGSMLSSLLKVVLSYTALPGDGNKWHWDAAIFREIIGFGKWIFATSILGFLAANGDRLVLGGLLAAKMLGMYSIAFFMVGSLRDIFAKLIGDVAFPALSEVARERPGVLKQTYYKFRQPLDVATLLATGVLFSAGHLVIQLLYDDRYFPAGHMLEIISIALFEIRYSLAGQCFIALGKPKLLIPIIGIQVISIYALMPLAFSLYGMEGALWIAGGSVLLTLPMTFYLKIQLGLFDISRELKSLPWLAYGLALGWVINQIARSFGLPG